ncbi:MAG: hypothetical protein KF888_12305 [Nitrosomonas sp.]|nr:hypothetical protein [Nitrosomonas sp.]
MISVQWNTPLHDNQLIFLVAACLVALVCFWCVFHYLKRARLIEDTPTSKIRSAAQGYVEIVGTVSPVKNREIVSPLAGKACVWYSYKVQRYQKSGKSSHWKTIEEGTSNQYFVIQDDTDACAVHPEGAEVLTAHSLTWYGNTPRPGQADNRHILLRTLSSRRYRYIEKFIYVHDVIYALGLFGTSGGGRNIPNNHQMTGQVIREWKENYSEIVRHFDRDKNGEIDLQEWEIVREAASREAEKRRQELTRLPTEHSLGRTSDKQHPFIVSTFSQKTLAKKFRRYAFFNLAGMVVSISAIAFYLQDWQSHLAMMPAQSNSVLSDGHYEVLQ